MSEIVDITNYSNYRPYGTKYDIPFGAMEEHYDVKNTFFECVCNYCGKGCKEPSPNCGRLAEIKFSLQECDRLMFLTDNFTEEELEAAITIKETK